MKEKCFFKTRSNTDHLLGSRGRSVHFSPHSLLIFVQKRTKINKVNPKIQLKSGITEISDCREGSARDSFAPGSWPALLSVTDECGTTR